MGRRSFNLINDPNSGVIPEGTILPWQVFVLTPSPHETVKKGSTTFNFVTDGIASAVKQAKVAAGRKNVAVMGAKTAQQCLKAGLLDEIKIHLVPVLLGEGIRLFDYLGTQHIELETTEVVEILGVTHLSYHIVK